MNSVAMFPQQTVVQTFRHLPNRIRQRLTPAQTRLVLEQKRRYYSGLTYTEKCRLTLERLSQAIYRRLHRQGAGIGPALIREVLRAEEAYYAYNLRAAQY